MNVSSISSRAITLSALSNRVAARLQSADLKSVWVTAELSDVRTSGPHLYMELLEKDPATGNILARMRAMAWANVQHMLRSKFLNATGFNLASGIKVMLCVSVNFHAAYGISLVISDIDPAYTLGEAERLRREILARLESEGVLDLNKSLEWPTPTLRIAVISAQGAAGYGDFMNQLSNNAFGLHFTTQLFPAVLQGERTAPSIIAALEEIAACDDQWDCVVIIRGGGATSDLASFDNYDLAANIAQFPLPVIVGIGHERDVTVLDYVANMRVKTPTAAAEWLISQASTLLAALDTMAQTIASLATAVTSKASTRLASLESLLSMAPANALQRATARLNQTSETLRGLQMAVTTRARGRLDTIQAMTSSAAMQAMRRAADRLQAQSELIHTLSPMATLKRGYSLTRINGHAVRSTSQVAAGTEIETILADGKITSTVK